MAQPPSFTDNPAAVLQQAVGDRYSIKGQVGEGGMATVFLAEDLKHHRMVAIKVLRPDLAHTIGLRRFLKEIEVIARLQHPHLLTLIDSGDVGGLPFYVMPYLEAQSLRELINAEKRLPVERAVTIAREVADGLAFAHSHGVIHRDIKPSNILMSGGHAVVADFGIATALEHASVGRLTQTGTSLGSPTYMSPEQAAGERDLDARTDVYSLACVLYEMLTGEPPIEGSMQQMVRRKLTGEIKAVRELRADVPAALDAAIQKALGTEREERFASIEEFSAAITSAAAARAPKTSRRTLIAGAAVVAVVVAGIAFWINAERRKTWAAQRLSEVNRLATAGEFAAAFALAQEVGEIVPDDTTLARLRPRFSDYISVVTAPAGASVYRQRMDTPNATWELMGTTPLDSVPVPRMGIDLPYRLRIEKEGFQRVEALPNLFAMWGAWRGVRPVDTLRLDAASAADERMVRVPGFRMRDTLHGAAADSISFGDYHIGRYEVTNAEFKRFVDAGGYTKREYWTEPFIHEGKTLGFDDAMRLFRDRSGLPGPATWSGGKFPDGQGDFPVGGVSYHEAAAYARFIGARLPSSQHWYRAALAHHREASWVYMPAANLGGGNAPRAVGQGHMNAYGLYDVAGNVREWLVNALDSGRMTRGAGWDDADYQVSNMIPRADFDRSPANGFRIVKFADHDTTVAHVAGRVLRAVPVDYSSFTPAPDAEFAIYKRLYDYDPLPLDARRDTGATRERFTWERVSFNGPVAGERMAAYVLLPKDAKPPYQAVVFWPGSNALSDRNFDPDRYNFEARMGFIPVSGRALVMPVGRGWFDRDDSLFTVAAHPRGGSRQERDLTIHWHKELRRTLDYLESRNDITPGAFGYYGMSWGGSEAPIALVVEPRIRAAVLNVGGIGGVFNWVPLPEVRHANFLPRVRTPTLMLNGRHDIVFPYETSQLPFFRMLGTPVADKKHVAYPASHFIPQTENVRETLAWFDKYLGRP